MPARMVMRRTVKKAKPELPHPKLCYLAPMGDEINEPLIISRKYNTITGTSVISGPRGYARQFGESDYINMGASYYIVEGAFTLMLFFNVGSFAATHYFIGGSSLDNSLRLTTASKFEILYGLTLVARSTAQSLSTDTWYHFAASFSGASGGWKMYLDGEPISLETNASGGRIDGRHIRPATNVVTRIDHIKAFSVQLSDSEIVQEMNKLYW